MTKKLSPTQVDTLTKARDHGSLVRLNGGFWTFPGNIPNERGVPTWWVGVTTIRGLESRGYLQRTNQRAEWCDDRKITESGTRVLDHS